MNIKYYFVFLFIFIWSTGFLSAMEESSPSLSNEDSRFKQSFLKYQKAHLEKMVEDTISTSVTRKSIGFKYYIIPALTAVSF